MYLPNSNSESSETESVLAKAAINKLLASIPELLTTADVTEISLAGVVLFFSAGLLLLVAWTIFGKRLISCQTQLVTFLQLRPHRIVTAASEGPIANSSRMEFASL